LTVFSDAGLIQDTIEQKLVVSAYFNTLPHIIKQGVRGGVYTWNVAIPLIVEYRSPKSIKTKKIALSLEIRKGDKNHQTCNLIVTTIYTHGLFEYEHLP
jgi:hypothetical protein